MRIEANNKYTVNYSTIDAIIQAVIGMGATSDGVEKLQAVCRGVYSNSYVVMQGKEILEVAGVTEKLELENKTIAELTRVVTADDIITMFGGVLVNG